MKAGPSVAGLAAALGQVSAHEALPADPPIGGPVWTVVVPAALLVFTSAATWLLYRCFSRGD